MHRDLPYYEGIRAKRCREYKLQTALLYWAQYEILLFLLFY